MPPGALQGWWCRQLPSTGPPRGRISEALFSFGVSRFWVIVLRPTIETEFGMDIFSYHKHFNIENQKLPSPGQNKQPIF
jgi:hypothetical protein